MGVSGRVTPVKNGDRHVVIKTWSRFRDSGYLERATRIELAFSAWEAEYGNCDDEPSCLIRARKSLAIQLKIYRQAYCGHTADNCLMGTQGVLRLIDESVLVAVGPSTRTVAGNL